MKEYVIRIFKGNEKLCGFKVEVDDSDMARIPEGTLHTILNIIANKCGLRIETEEFIVLSISK